MNSRTILVCFTVLICSMSLASPTASADENHSPQYGQHPVNRAPSDASIYQRPAQRNTQSPSVALAGFASPDVATSDAATTPNVASDPGKKTQFPRLLVSKKDDGAETPLESKNQFAAPLVTVTSSLAVVLGLFAALVWVSRKYGSKTMGGAIPNEVIQTLGSTPIDPRTRITMIRLGNRILVVAQTASGITPISEITDPEEVRNLTAHCIGDSKAQFSDTLQSIEREPAGDGFLGQPAAAPKARNRGSLFTTA